MTASKLIFADETYQKAKVLIAAIKPILVMGSNRFGLARLFQCAVKRRGISVGEIPTRQQSLQPVATGAVVEVTKRSKPLV